MLHLFTDPIKTLSSRVCAVYALTGKTKQRYTNTQIHRKTKQRYTDLNGNDSCTYESTPVKQLKMRLDICVELELAQILM